MTLKEIIADAKTYPDNFVITLASGVTVTMGDLRAQSKETISALSKREETIKQNEDKLTKDLETLRLAQAETARMYAELQSGKLPDGSTHKPDADNPLERMTSDPVLGPIAKSIIANQQQLKEFQEKTIAPIANAMKAMATAYVDDRVADMYERVVPDAKRADLPVEKVLQVARDRGYMSKSGVPDIRRAYQDLATTPISPDDLQKQIKEAEERGAKAAEEKLRAAQAPRVVKPGAFGGPRVPAEGEPKPFKSIGEALAAAAADSDLWKSIDQIQ